MRFVYLLVDCLVLSLAAAILVVTVMAGLN